MKKFASFFITTVLLFSMLAVAQAPVVALDDAGIVKVRSYQGFYFGQCNEGIPDNAFAEEVYSSVFQGIDVSQEELFAKCSEENGEAQIVQTVLDKTQGKDLSALCISLEDAANQCESSKTKCEDLKRKDDYTCPPDEAKMVARCMQEFSKPTDRCEEEWGFNHDRITAVCTGGLKDFELYKPTKFEKFEKFDNLKFDSSNFARAGEECTKHNGKWVQNHCEFESYAPLMDVDTGACPPSPTSCQGGKLVERSFGTCKFSTCEFEGDYLPKDFKLPSDQALPEGVDKAKLHDYYENYYKTVNDPYKPPADYRVPESFVPQEYKGRPEAYKFYEPPKDYKPPEGFVPPAGHELPPGVTAEAVASTYFPPGFTPPAGYQPPVTSDGQYTSPTPGTVAGQYTSPTPTTAPGYTAPAYTPPAHTEPAPAYTAPATAPAYTPPAYTEPAPAYTPPVTQSPRSITGFQVAVALPPVSETAPSEPAAPSTTGEPQFTSSGGAPSLDFCAEGKSGFLKKCREAMFAASQTVDETQRQSLCTEMIRKALPHMQQFCTQGRGANLYGQCREESTKNCGCLKNKATRCTSFANRDKFKEVISKRVSVECRKRQFTGVSDTDTRTRDVLSGIDDLKSDLSIDQRVVAAQATEKIVLTQEELEQIKTQAAEEAKKDALIQLKNLLGLQAGQIDQHIQALKEQRQELVTALGTMKELVATLPDESQESGRQALDNLQAQVDSIDGEIAQLEQSKGGLAGDLARLFGLS